MSLFFLVSVLGCLGFATLRQAITGLDPDTLALPDELQEDTREPLTRVRARFVEAPDKLALAALLCLTAACGALWLAVAWPSAVLVSTGAVLGLVFGFILPSWLARGHEARILARSARLVLALAWVLAPLAKTLAGIAHLLTTFLGGRGPEEAHGAPRRQPAEAPSGALEKVLTFAGTEVAELMTPRLEMATVAPDASVRDLARLVEATRHGRFPVCGDNLDDLRGIVDIADLLLEEGGRGTVEGKWRPVSTVLETTNVWQQVVAMERRGEAMGLAVDEFGSVTGLVTHADLVTDIVGQIAEEGDPQADDYQKLGDGVWSLNAALRVERVNEVTGLGLPDGDYETLAGFLLSRVRRVPRIGHMQRFENATFEVTAANARRIVSVKVRADGGGRRAVPPKPSR